MASHASPITGSRVRLRANPRATVSVESRRRVGCSSGGKHPRILGSTQVTFGHRAWSGLGCIGIFCGPHYFARCSFVHPNRHWVFLADREITFRQFRWSESPEGSPRRLSGYFRKRKRNPDQAQYLRQAELAILGLESLPVKFFHTRREPWNRD
jgi:hypothetical protein